MPAPEKPATRRRPRAAAALAGLLAFAAWLAPARGPRLPPELTGAIVFVSDRDGVPALYWRRLPRDRERRLGFGSEPAGEPAVSPDGTRVAFSMNGRVGMVAVASGEVEVLTLGIDWKDAQPAWFPDGRRLAVSARRRVGEPASLHVLEPARGATLARQPLTQARAGDDLSPAPSPDGRFVVFVREDRLMRVELADGGVTRISGGFKRDRSPRFLDERRLVCAWSEGKRHGIDVIELATRARTTLAEGGVFYRTVAPSPDARFLVVTRSWDTGLDPLAFLFGGQREEVHLLDAGGGERARLEGSRRQSNHSPDWGR
jgi:Tol biopolymer transport system component